jgi:hypothetical protein
MAIVKYINGFGELSRVLARVAIEEPLMVATCMLLSEPILKRNVQKVFGDKSKLAALSQYTIDERIAMNYPPDLPLLRDGSLLRDHIESDHTPTTASVGSAEPVQLYSETGSINVKFQTTNPPRPALKIACLSSEKEVVTVFENGIGILLR